MTIRTKDIPAHAAASSKKRQRHSKEQELSDKTFEELTQEQKDAILKELAIRFRMVKES